MPVKVTDKTTYDYLLMVIVALLVVIGLMMVYSSTFTLTPAEPTSFFVRQLRATGIGLVALLVFAKAPYNYWRRLSVPIMAATVVLLVGVLLLGESRFGARLGIHEGSFQPGEIAKLAVVLYVADWLSSKGEKIRNITYGLLPFGILIGSVAFLMVLQPDLGTAILVVITAITMFFLAGADLLQLILGSVFTGAAFMMLISQSAHASKRLSDFLSSVSDPVGQADHQVQQALIGLGRGGIFGRGLGESQQKVMFLPLPHSDSIFAILGEELGLVGCLIVIALFAAFAYRGFKIALQSPDNFGMILASGITCWLIFQAIINMAVVTATLPFTGITLPFISFGGSSMAASLAAIGLLLSISKRNRIEDTKAHANLDSGRRDSRSRLPHPGSHPGVGKRRKADHASAR